MITKSYRHFEGKSVYCVRGVISPLLPLIARHEMDEAKSHTHHTLEGDPVGFDWLGFNIRQDRVGNHPSGKRSNGQRLGFKTRIKPAKANMAAHRAELGRMIGRGKVLSQGTLIHQLHPKIRGGANYYRTSVSQAAFDRLDCLTWEKLRRWGRSRNLRCHASSPERHAMPDN